MIYWQKGRRRIMVKDKIYPLSYNKDYYTVMSNDILKGKQEMTLQEARLIRFLVTQVVKEDKDLKTYTMRISEFADFLNIDSSNLYKDIRLFCSDLLKLQVRIGTGNPKEPWKIFQWLQLAEYDGNGNLTLMLSNQIKPYVTELNSCFTQYQLKNILAMHSYYAVRLYELLKMWVGLDKYKQEFTFSIIELREYFSCENKYSRIIDFKKNVIETAVKEINAKTDLIITHKYNKTGRAITNITFEVHYNIKKQIKGKISFDGDPDDK